MKNTSMISHLLRWNYLHDALQLFFKRRKRGVFSGEFLSTRVVFRRLLWCELKVNCNMEGLK